MESEEENFFSQTHKNLRPDTGKLRTSKTTQFGALPPKSEALLLY